MSLNCLTRPGTKTENLSKTKKQTPTKIWTKISETKISQTLLEGRKTRDGKADKVREKSRIFRREKKNKFQDLFGRRC
jgi:hypothetical protein